MSRISIIPTEKILERLRYENPWWINKRIPEVLVKWLGEFIFSGI